MKKKIYLISLLFLFFSRFSTAQIICIYCYDQNDTISANVTNLISNGGFETGCTPDSENISFCPNSMYYACGFLGWVGTGGGDYTYACAIDSFWSALPEGSKGAYFGNNESKVCSSSLSDTSCIVNTSCTVTGIPPGYPESDVTYYGGANGVSLQQTVNGLIVGDTYVLEFWAGGEYHFIGVQTFTNKGLFAVDVGFGDTLLREKPTPPVTGIGTRYIVEFIANSTSHTIKFTNWGHICQTCTELIIDDVRLYTLAELSPSVPSCNTGLSDATALPNGIIISPNPFTSEFNIKSNGNELLEITLYDITSRKLLHQKFMNSVSLNTKQLAKGIYLYEVRNKNEVIKKGKVVKE